MTKHFYIKFIVLFFLIFWLKVDLYAQSVLSSSEEVCAGETKSYRVEGFSGSTIHWGVTGGEILNDGSPEGSSFSETTILSGIVYQSVIQVKWGNVAGVFQLIAREETVATCVSNDLILDVTVKPKPDISNLDFTISSPVCSNTAPVFTVAGLVPSTSYTIGYNDNGISKVQTVTTDVNGRCTLNVNPITASATYRVETVAFDGNSCFVTSSQAAKVVEISTEPPVISGCLANAVWREDFSYSNGTHQQTNNGVKWTGLPLTGHDRIRVNNNKIETHVQDVAVRNWHTDPIDISADSPVSVSVDVEAWSGNGAGNSIDFQCRLDGGEFVSYKTLTGGFTDRRVLITGLSGNTVELKIVVTKAAGAAVYYFDNVVVYFDNVVVTGYVEKEADVDKCAYTVQENEFDVTATDDCEVVSLTYKLSGATTGTGTSLSNVELNNGLTTITWTATDNTGNIASCSFGVFVDDTTPPVLADLSDLTIVDCADDETITPQVKSFTGMALPARYTDNCTTGFVVEYRIQNPDASFANAYGVQATGATSAADPSGFEFKEGISTIYFRVLDGSGNVSNVRTYTVSVNHKPNPSEISF